MGDWNEWENMKDTMVNDTPILPQNKLLSKIKLTEECRNKYIYFRKIDDRKKRITMYSSNYSGGWAVNAVDNTPYNIKIGTNEEKYLFSIRFTREKFIGRESDIITLFYDSPYAYEAHHGVTLNPNIINNWYTIFNKLPHKKWTYKNNSNSLDDSDEHNTDSGVIVVK